MPSVRIPAARVSITLNGQPLEWAHFIATPEGTVDPWAFNFKEQIRYEGQHLPLSRWRKWLRRLRCVATGNRTRKQLRARKRRRNHAN